MRNEYGKHTDVDTDTDALVSELLNPDPQAPPRRVQVAAPSIPPSQSQITALSCMLTSLMYSRIRRGVLRCAERTKQA